LAEQSLPSPKDDAQDCCSTRGRSPTLPQHAAEQVEGVLEAGEGLRVRREIAVEQHVAHAMDRLDRARE